MSLLEHEPGDQDREIPYYRAARFDGEKPAGLAYSKAQEAIYKTDCELSAFRFQLRRLWHVAVLGDLPPDTLKERLETILSTGERAVLPPDILGALQQRRAQAIRKGPWVEGHYKPGRRLL